MDLATTRTLFPKIAEKLDVCRESSGFNLSVMANWVGHTDGYIFSVVVGDRVISHENLSEEDVIIWLDGFLARE